MPMFSLTLDVTVDRRFAFRDPLPIELARDWAHATGMSRESAICTSGEDGALGVLGCVDCDPSSLPDRLSSAARTLATVLAAAGIRVLAWRSIGSESVELIERRIRNTTPDLVDAGEFAEMCGISRNRIHQLASAARRARADGRYHPFPEALVPGYWVRTMAHGFARCRRTRPGPTRPTGIETYLGQVLARRKAEREGGPLPEVDHSLLPTSLEECLEQRGYDTDEIHTLVSGRSIPVRHGKPVDGSDHPV